MQCSQQHPLRRHRRRRLRQITRPPRAKYRHYAKTPIKQHHRISHQSPHTRHATCTRQFLVLHPLLSKLPRVLTNNRKHRTRAVRAPHDGQAREEISEEAVEGDDDAEDGDQHEGEETVAEDRGGARVGEGGREVRGAARGRVGVLRGGHFSWGEGRGHEGEDGVQEEGAEDGESCK